MYACVYLFCPDNRTPYSTKSPSGAGSHAVTVPSKGKDTFSKPYVCIPVFDSLWEASTWCLTSFSHRTTWQGRPLFLWQESAPKRSQGSPGHPLHPGSPPSGRHCDSLPQTSLYKKADSLQGSPVLCTPHRRSVNAQAFSAESGQALWLATQWPTGTLDRCIVHQGTLTLYPRSGFWASGMPSKAMCFYLFIYFNGCEWFSGRKYIKKENALAWEVPATSLFCAQLTRGRGRYPLRDTFMALNRMVLPQLVTKVSRWEAPRGYERASDICLSRIALTCEIIPSAVPGWTTFWRVGGNVQVSMSLDHMSLSEASSSSPGLSPFDAESLCIVCDTSQSYMVIYFIAAVFNPTCRNTWTFTIHFMLHFYHVSPWLRLFSKLN